MKAGFYIVKSVDEILAMPRHKETKGKSKKTLLKMMAQDYSVYDSVVGSEKGDFVVGMLATCGKLVELASGFDRRGEDCWWYHEDWVIPITKKEGQRMVLLKELSALEIRRNEIEEELRKLNTKKGGKK